MAEPEAGGASRRTLLACTGAACAAVVAGCTTYNANKGGLNAPPPTSGGASSGGGATGGGTGGGAAAALATTASVPVGGGTILSAKQIVITQPTAGAFKAFTAVCTHQGCIVDQVANGTIDCPCHGSKFSIKDGSVVNGPAASPLAAIAIKVEGTSIVQG